MPIKPENRGRYPRYWPELSEYIRVILAHNCCEKCGAPNHCPHPITGKIVHLSVAHLNHIPEICDRANLRALCQRCHLNHDIAQHVYNRKATIARKDRERTLGPLFGWDQKKSGKPA